VTEEQIALEIADDISADGSAAIETDQPRIGPVDVPTPAESALLAKVDGGNGSGAPNLFRTLVRHPGLMKRVNAMGGELLLRGVLSPREREAAILRVAYVSRCQYERSHHQASALKCGLSTDEVDWLTSASPTGADRDPVLAAIRAAVDALAADYTLSDELWERLSDRYGERDLLELLLLVGFYLMLAGVANTLKVPQDSETFAIGTAAEEFESGSPTSRA
jgi:alkylhydroperoxidase family enzyme